MSQLNQTQNSSAKPALRSPRRKMVRKQVYILSQQETKLKALAHRQQITEAELIRQAVDALLNQPLISQANALPVNETAWQVILAFVEQREQSVPAGSPYQWQRADGYDDERSARAWNTMASSI